MSKYSYGARIDKDSNAVTVIDETEKTATTKGYVNGEYVEFSGGGVSENPIILERVYNQDTEQYEYNGSLTFGEARIAFISGTPIFILVEEHQIDEYGDLVRKEFSLVTDISWAYDNVSQSDAYITYQNGTLETANYVNPTLEGLDSTVIGQIINE